LATFQVQVLVADCCIIRRDEPNSFTPKGEYGNEDAGLNNSLVCAPACSTRAVSRHVPQTIVYGTTKSVRTGFVFATDDDTRGLQLFGTVRRSVRMVLSGTAVCSEGTLLEAMSKAFRVRVPGRFSVSNLAAIIGVF
jgi:hypothetical protein